MKIFFVLTAMVVTSILNTAAHAEPPIVRDDLPDFSDYVPEYPEDDAYIDETFMYFGKSFGLSFGTGAEIWSGALGEVFKPAYPILDFRLTSFTDIRSALQFGCSIATHPGNIPLYGSSEMRLLLLYIDWKHYFEPSPKMSGHIASAAPYFSLGLSYVDLNLKYHDLNQENNFRGLEWKAPILGKLPFPVWPSLALGVDFALNPRNSSLTLEGRWRPLGSYFGKSIALDELTGERRLGDLFLFTSYVTFVFD